MNYVLILFIPLIVGVKSGSEKEHEAGLIFNVVNTSYLEVEWTHLVEGKLEDIQEVILYQVLPEAHTKIGFAKAPFTSNRRVLVNHDICLRLKNVFMRIVPKDKYKHNPFYDSPETSYFPPSLIQEIISAICIEKQKKAVEIPFKDNFRLSTVSFQKCVTRIEYQTSRADKWDRIKFFQNFKVIKTKKSIFVKVTAIDPNGDGKRTKHNETEIKKADMKTCETEQAPRKGREHKEINFRRKYGRDGQLQFKALNSTHLKVLWTKSFELEFDVIKSVELFKTGTIGPVKFGEVQPPFEEKDEIVTNQVTDLCLPQVFFVVVKAKDEFSSQPWYKTHISQETDWFSPSFLKMIREASCFNNDTGNIFIPFMDNETLRNDLFKKCVPTLEYQGERGNFININKRENMNIKLKDELTIRIKTFVRTDKENILREEKDVLTAEMLELCKLENLGTEVMVGESSDVGLVGGIVGGVLGGIILTIAIAILVMKVKGNKTEEVAEDMNPDYGYDYGEAEIRDTNDYYFAEDYDDGDEKEEIETKIE